MTVGTGRRIRHTVAELVRTACLLAVQCRRDHDDATVLRDDPACRLATAGGRGWRGCRLWAQNGGRRLRRTVVDVDSLPVRARQVAGQRLERLVQAKVYHPLVASSAETGDMLDARLREGRAHTAAGGTEFVLAVPDRVRRLPRVVGGVLHRERRVSSSAKATEACDSPTGPTDSMLKAAHRDVRHSAHGNAKP